MPSPSPTLWPTASIPEFSLASEVLGSTHRIAPSGELDLATGIALERELLRVEETAAHVIEVDLSAVTFIDCAAIRLLTNAHARMNRDCVRLRVKPGGPTVQRVLALVGADKTLPFPVATPSAGGRRRAHVETRLLTEWSH